MRWKLHSKIGGKNITEGTWILRIEQLVLSLTFTSSGCLHSLEWPFEATVTIGFLSLAADANPNQFREQTGNSLGIWTVLVMICLFIYFSLINILNGLCLA